MRIKGCTLHHFNNLIDIVEEKEKLDELENLKDNMKELKVDITRNSFEFDKILRTCHKLSLDSNFKNFITKYVKEIPFSDESE